SLLGCVAPLGFAAATKIGGRSLPLRERLVLSVPLGLLGFVLLWSSLGALGLFNSVTFFAAPLVCLGAGAPTSIRALRRVLAHRGSLTALRQPSSMVGMLALAGGVLGMFFVYAPCITPQNAAFDSRWYHLAVAEHFAAAHRYTGFPDGWALGGMPFFATLVYTWGFVMPSSILFDRIELCAHIEFFVFIATIFSIPVLVRRVLPGSKGRLGATWAAIFLFPGIFLYDSSLNLGADHFAALWAVPIFLTFLRASREFAPRPSFLLGLAVGAAISTKYTAFGLGVIPGIGVFVRAITLGIRSARRHTGFEWVKSLPLMVGAILLASSHFWVKNLLAFGNPLFPFAAELFPTHPWVPESAARLAAVSPKEWMPTRDLSGVEKTLKTAFTFAFSPNDWVTFHKDWPVFGPLFTLTTPLVAFVRRPGRLVMLYVAGYLFVLIWYWTFHQDRYLQACLPWMAAGTAAVLSSIWQSRAVLPKVPCALLVSVQVASSLDIPFFPTHAMMDNTPLKAVIDMAASGFTGRPKSFFKVYSEWAQIGEKLPKDARVLLHENQTHLGIGAQTLTDQLQTGISYLDQGSPEKIYDLYEKLGVTHIVTNGRTSKSLDNFGGDVAFFNFVTQYGERPKTIGGHVLYRMPHSRPKSHFRGRVLWTSCAGWYKNGVYAIKALSVTPRYGYTLRTADFPPPLYATPDVESAVRALPDVDAIVNNPGCFRFDAPLDASGFVDVASRDGAEIWVRAAPNAE
ncbi:MAG TPA: hypothetical protein VHU80_17085, partial [Polyangiaceae bacterium]|nr:hypothetical protein [Polyangiaceae bacterium]